MKNLVNKDDQCPRNFEKKFDKYFTKIHSKGKIYVATCIFRYDIMLCLVLFTYLEWKYLVYSQNWL